MRIIRRHELTDKVGHGLAHIHRLERAGLFPRRVQLGPRAVGWVEEEVERWLRERADARDREPSAIDLEAPREVLVAVHADLVQRGQP